MLQGTTPSFYWNSSSSEGNWLSILNNLISIPPFVPLPWSIDAPFVFLVFRLSIDAAQHFLSTRRLFGRLVVYDRAFTPTLHNMSSSGERSRGKTILLDALAFPFRSFLFFSFLVVNDWWRDRHVIIFIRHSLHLCVSNCFLYLFLCVDSTMYTQPKPRVLRRSEQFTSTPFCTFTFSPQLANFL